MKKDNWIPIFINDKKSIECLLLRIHNFIKDNIDESNTPIGLMMGNSGILLFLKYYNNHFRENDISFFKKIFNDEINNLENKNLSPTFCDGFTGIGWVLSHLNNNESQRLDFNSFEDIDKHVLVFGLKSIKGELYDYFYGGLGALNYFIERNNIDVVKLLTNELIKKRHTTDNLKFSWNSNHIRILENNLVEYNLGLAHGVPSILATLLNVYKLTPTKTIKTILENTVEWLLTQQNDLSISKSYFSAYSNGIPVNKNCRLGWCYGDLTIAYTLLRFGEDTNDTNTYNKAIEIALNCCIRDEEINNTPDLGFCHGKIGIGHILNRFFQKTKIATFKESSCFWYSTTIAETTDLINSYNDFPNLIKQNDLGLLEGLSGIGLCLISTIDYEVPNWDKSFLLS